MSINYVKVLGRALKSLSHQNPFPGSRLYHISAGRVRSRVIQRNINNYSHTVIVYPLLFDGDVRVNPLYTGPVRVSENYLTAYLYGSQVRVTS